MYGSETVQGQTMESGMNPGDDIPRNRAQELWRECVHLLQGDTMPEDHLWRMVEDRCRRHGLNQEDAEEVTSEVLVSFFMRYSTRPDMAIERPTAYLYA